MSVGVELLPGTGVAREVMGMNPLNYMEKKLRTTKIITVNNSQDKGLLVRFPLNTSNVYMPKWQQIGLLSTQINHF